MTSTDYPLISVIIPTYKRSTLLPRAIDSVLEQSWKNIEIIVVDDNVPQSDFEKETYLAIKPYLDDSRVFYLKTPQSLGGGGARNMALFHCHGEYVAFLDDDDVYLPGKLEKQVLFMIANQLDGSYQDVIWVDSNEKLVEYRSLKYECKYTTEELLKIHILHSIAPTAIYMLKRDKLLETKGFGEVSSGQDFILMLRCIESGFKIAYMEGAYVKQYLHKGERISLGESKIKGENILYNLKKQYFHLLSKSEQRYVKFRHYAVLSFASMRNHNYIDAMNYSIITLISSPTFCIKEAFRYFGSKKRSN